MYKDGPRVEKVMSARDEKVNDEHRARLITRAEGRWPLITKVRPSAPFQGHLQGAE